MSEGTSTVVINEVEAEPLSEYVLDFLISQKRECPYLDFKYTIHVGKNSNFPEIAKDIFAFSNYGGGWILVGWKEEKSSQFVPVGLPEDYEVDQAVIQEKFNSYSNIHIELEYAEFIREVDGEERRFAVLFVPPSYDILKPIKDGTYKKNEKLKTVFKKDDIFFRRGTQSIKPSKKEMEIINKRIDSENYRISLLSGEPDQVGETLYSNLFPVKKLPDYVYSGRKIDEFDNRSIKLLLNQENVFPWFFFKFKEWNKKIVTFEDLTDTNNVYRKLVDEDTIQKEPLDSWLNDPDKSRIIMEILRKEVIHFAISKGLFHSRDSGKSYLYYPVSENKRKIGWSSRYGRSSTRTVGSKLYAKQLGRKVYWHVAFNLDFIKLNEGKFFFRVLPSFVITEDGRKNVSKGLKEGTIKTRLAYDKYNDSYLNTVSFWINQLGDGKDIVIGDYLKISSEPLKGEIPYGIVFDIPPSEHKLILDEEAEFFEGGDVTEY